MARSIASWLAVAAVLGQVWAGLEVDFDSPDSIRAAAKLKAHDVMSYYKGNLSGEIPGLLPGPPPIGDYYWWESGALWGLMIDYWHYTGDTLYNDEVVQGIRFQTGAEEGSAFMPVNYTATMGNDDQAFWALSALLAAEVGFKDLPADEPQWPTLAQNVFDTQAARFDEKTCNGGLRWQISFANVGYDFKNTASNGLFFNLGARLAHFTQNKTYSDWATKTWDWMESTGFIDDEYRVFDGAHVSGNCSDISKTEFSFTAAGILQGAAFMYNQTSDDAWKKRVQGLLDNILSVFFPDGVADEQACEHSGSCNTDMLSYKGYTLRWLAATAQMAPFTHDQISKALKTSAEVAVKQCTSGKSGRECGFSWTGDENDGTSGVGQEMNVLSALITMLMDSASTPLTSATSGSTGQNGTTSSSGSSGQNSTGTAGRDDSNSTTTGTGAAANGARPALLTVFFVSGCAMLATSMLFGWSEAL